MPDDKVQKDAFDSINVDPYLRKYLSPKRTTLKSNDLLGPHGLNPLSPKGMSNQTTFYSPLPLKL